MSFSWPYFFRPSSEQGRHVTSSALFNYLLSHERAYGLRVVRMEPVYEPEDGKGFSNEFGLIRQSSSR